MDAQEIILIFALAVLVVCRRFRRAVARQKVRYWLLTLSVVSLSLFFLSLIIRVGLRPPLVPGMVVGSLLGLSMGWFSLRFTEFLREEDAVFYRPNPYLGISVFFVVAGWLTWRFYALRQVFSEAGGTQNSTTGMAEQLMAVQTPWSIMMLAFLISYHLPFLLGVILRARRLRVGGNWEIGPTGSTGQVLKIVSGNLPVTIDVENCRFDADNNNNSPVDTVTINVGDTVLWIWRAGVHTITSGESSSAPDVGDLFDVPSNGSNQSFSYTFTEAGTVPYFCRPHESLNMKGVIVVQ